MSLTLLGPADEPGNVFLRLTAEAQETKFNCMGAFQPFSSIVFVNIPLAKVSSEAQSQGARKRTWPTEAGAVKGAVNTSVSPARVRAEVLAECSQNGTEGKRIIGFQGFPRGLFTF